MKIHCDVCWNRHIFQCLSFKQDLLIYFLHPKENGIQLPCIGRYFNVYFIVNNGRLSNPIDSLEYRCNFACVLLFYRYYSGFCLIKIWGLIPVPNHIFVCNTVFLGNHIRMLPIGQRIAQYLTDINRSLVEQFVCGTTLAQRL